MPSFCLFYCPEVRGSGLTAGTRGKLPTEAGGCTHRVLARHQLVTGAKPEEKRRNIGSSSPSP